MSGVGVQANIWILKAGSPLRCDSPVLKSLLEFLGSSAVNLPFSPIFYLNSQQDNTKLFMNKYQPKMSGNSASQYVLSTPPQPDSVIKNIEYLANKFGYEKSVKGVNNTCIALSAIIIQFLLSDDTEFAPVGKNSKINYKKDFIAYLSSQHQQVDAVTEALLAIRLANDELVPVYKVMQILQFPRTALDANCCTSATFIYPHYGSVQCGCQLSNGTPDADLELLEPPPAPEDNYIDVELHLPEPHPAPEVNNKGHSCSCSHGQGHVLTGDSEGEATGGSVVAQEQPPACLTRSQRTKL
ncbi:hypothetical protein BDP27DRAFT_1502901 [Rhodocollybia butyracea]|uniref:Uncharacterized protein n=1 Tax=Rhodocollybia butyracea TaxID=206335 RepID=A0A9P5PS96_9AGAR|nr:hypothetical protein BDP27DRAFT_1502901 [Rhodocollybia butyracea]